MTLQNRQQRRTAASIHRRSQKDATTTEAVGDNGWDDLSRLYMQCQALSTSPSQVLPLLKDSEQLAKVKDIHALKQQSEVLRKDAEAYKTRLENIQAKHAGRSGSTENPDELMFVLALGEEYQEWLHSYQSVVLPTVQNILQLFTEEKLETEGEYIPAGS